MTKLYELGAALLFFGVFAGQTELHESGRATLSELAAHGYQLPSEDNPVRIFPALTAGEFQGGHAGGWRPGSIYLRAKPQGGLSETVYLRHELLHEMSYRTCGGRLPLWAEEAAAMSFSGELTALANDAPPTADEVEALKARIQQGADLRTGERQTLGRLLLNHSWPTEACAVSEKLADMLGAAFNQTGSSGYILTHLISGRILAAGGDQHHRYPPGSLLKIPYSAALREANPQTLSDELLRSDTDKLLQRKAQFDAARFRLLLSPLKPDADKIPAADNDAAAWRGYVGERGSDGQFPFATNLPELARVMRAALLMQPRYFQGLAANGSTADSTLAKRDDGEKQLLRQLQALAKTGTVSDTNGNPLLGHLLVAWPQPHPQFLAIFRQRGATGAQVLAAAAPLLKQWQHSHPPRWASAKVRLLTLAPRSEWQAEADCPEWRSDNRRFSVCGEFQIHATTRGSRSERRVSGVLYEQDNGMAVLETDMQSYVDAVLAAEAQTLTGSAKEAMQAVIAWNAAHGAHRHRDSRALCDTTHCMVFLGAPPDNAPSRQQPLDMGLLNSLDKQAKTWNLEWLSFASGGDEHWLQLIKTGDLAARFNEAQILDIRRERRKDGAVFIHLFYSESEETLSCEVFRNRLKLPSCPDSVIYHADGENWRFQGVGAGHGLGLSVARAKTLSAAGRNAAEILQDAYQPPPVR